MSGERGKPVALACLIASRNLGDIVMWSGLMRQLTAADYAERFIVWTRPMMACLFEELPRCEVICSSFPVGTGMRFGLPQLMGMLEAAQRIRARSPQVVLDFVGDFRERFLARLVGGRHLQIGWGPGHGHRRLIRNPLGAGRPWVTVPASVPNVYAGYQLMLEALDPEKLKLGAAHPLPARPVRRIGLHPFASLPSKIWPAQRWRELAQELARRRFELCAFSSAHEAQELAAIFRDLPVARLATTDIRQYRREIQQLDLLIGLDSQSVHMAHLHGVPSITLNAGNPPELFAVPSGQMLADSGGCPHYPCFNLAPCRAPRGEHACMKAIAPQRVLAAVDALVGARARTPCSDSRAANRQAHTVDQCADHSAAPLPSAGAARLGTASAGNAMSRAPGAGGL